MRSPRHSSSRIYIYTTARDDNSATRAACATEEWAGVLMRGHSRGSDFAASLLAHLSFCLQGATGKNRRMRAKWEHPIWYGGSAVRCSRKSVVMNESFSESTVSSQNRMVAWWLIRDELKWRLAHRFTKVRRPGIGALKRPTRHVVAWIQKSRQSIVLQPFQNYPLKVVRSSAPSDSYIVHSKKYLVEATKNSRKWGTRRKTLSMNESSI